MNKDKGSVDGLKDKLYSRQHQEAMQDVRAPLTREDIDVPKAWEAKTGLEPRAPRPAAASSKLSFATKFFIVSAGFFAVTVAVGAVAFFWGPNSISPANIDIQLVAPSLVNGGKQADFQIIINNKNPAELELADLVIDYPDGSRDPSDPSRSLLHERQSLGTIAAASQVKRTASILLYGPEGVAQTVRATLEYSVAGSNAVFTRAGEATVTIGSSPVSVLVNTPSQVVAGQAFPLSVVVRSNSTQTVDNVIVQGQLPFGYAITSSDPQVSGGNVWKIGSLQPAQEKTINITGTIDGQDGDQRVFKFVVGTNTDPTDTTIQVPLLTMPATVTISRPFIGATIAVNGQSSRTVSATAGSTVSGSVNWQNNLSVAVANLQVTLKLSGPMIDKSSINPGTGFYRSADNSIVWSSEQDPTLASAAAGQGGQLTFSFKTVPPGQGGVVYTNPSATLDATVAADRPADQSGGAQSVSSTVQTQVSFASQVSLSAQARYTQGPNPPMANQATTYMISWSAKNSSNTVGNTTVSAVLPPYVAFVSGGQDIAYDNNSRTVTWQIGDMPAGAGYTKAALGTTFVVTVTPSTSQVGSSPAITGTAALSGTDRFANVRVQATAPAPTVDNQVVGQ